MIENSFVILKGYKLTEEEANILHEDPIALSYMRESNSQVAHPKYILGYRLNSRYNINESQCYMRYYIVDDIYNIEALKSEETGKTLAEIAKKYNIDRPMHIYFGIEVY